MAANTTGSPVYAVPKILRRLGEGLASLGHQVDYIFADDLGSRRLGGRMSFVGFPAFLAAEVSRRQVRDGYDVLLAHSGTGWLCGLMRRTRGRRWPRLATFSQGWEELLWEQHLEEARRGRARMSRYHRLFYPMVHIGQARAAARLADAVVVCSSEERDQVLRSLRVPERKVHFVPNGVGPEYLAVEHAYPERASRLLCVAYWSWRKGQRYLLEAYRELRTRHPELTLSLVGTRVSEEVVRAGMPTDLAAGIRVVPEEDETSLLEEYRSHDLLVMPTLFEGMSLVVLEAMATGLPVVATAVSGALDVIENGVEGLLVPRRDPAALAGAVDRALADASLRRGMAEAARRRVAGLAWDRVAHRLAKVLEAAEGAE